MILSRIDLFKTRDNERSCLSCSVLGPVCLYVYVDGCIYVSICMRVYMYIVYACTYVHDVYGIVLVCKLCGYTHIYTCTGLKRDSKAVVTIS